MTTNIGSLLNKLQSLCDEKALACAADFAQHEDWLLGTFKANALQKLTRPKVELACPTSAKKQKTSEGPVAPTAIESEPVDMQTDSVEEPTPTEVRTSQRSDPILQLLMLTRNMVCRLSLRRWPCLILTH